MTSEYSWSFWYPALEVWPSIVGSWDDSDSERGGGVGKHSRKFNSGVKFQSLVGWQEEREREGESRTHGGVEGVFVDVVSQHVGLRFGSCRRVLDDVAHGHRGRFEVSSRAELDEEFLRAGKQARQNQKSRK